MQVKYADQAKVEATVQRITETSLIGEGFMITDATLIAAVNVKRFATSSCVLDCFFFSEVV